MPGRGASAAVVEFPNEVASGNRAGNRRALDRGGAGTGRSDGLRCDARRCDRGGGGARVSRACGAAGERRRLTTNTDVVRSCFVSQWSAARARRVLAALLRIGWVIKRQSGSHRTLARTGWPDFVFAFHDGVEIGSANAGAHLQTHRSPTVRSLTLRGRVRRATIHQNFLRQARRHPEGDCRRRRTTPLAWWVRSTTATAAAARSASPVTC